VAAVAALLVLGAGCAAGSAAPGARSTAIVRSAPGSSRTAPSGTPIGVAPPGGVSVFGRVFLSPSLTVADGSLYLTWELAPPTRLPSRMALARVDAADGQIVAENEFSPGFVSLPLSAAGSLWVTDSSPAGELLLRLDSRTLMVTGELEVAGTGAGAAADGHVAFAGGSIWVDGAGRLVQVAPDTVAARRIIPLPGAVTSNVAASPDGGTLIVSEADGGGSGTVQRRDPATGALLASHRVLGVFAPLVGGVTEDVAWISEPTGMMGYVERFQTAAMTPDPATLVEGTNGIRANLWDGALWVSNQAGGTAVNYCADPSTGRRLAPLPFRAINQDTLEAVGGHDLYYSYFASDGSRSRIAAAPIPAACTRGR
jgi:hypothetical protein